MMDYYIAVAEILFKLTNGVMLIDTIWFLPYVILLSCIIIIPLYIYFYKLSSETYVFLLFCGFGIVILIGVGPIAFQTSSMIECNKTEAIISTPNVQNATIMVNECRYKKNYYEDFGEWEIRKND
jgi:hypothetical protein